MQKKRENKGAVAPTAASVEPWAKTGQCDIQALLNWAYADQQVHRVSMAGMFEAERVLVMRSSGRQEQPRVSRDGSGRAAEIEMMGTVIDKGQGMRSGAVHAVAAQVEEAVGLLLPKTARLVRDYASTASEPRVVINEGAATMPYFIAGEEERMTVMAGRAGSERRSWIAVKDMLAHNTLAQRRQVAEAYMDWYMAVDGLVEMLAEDLSFKLVGMTRARIVDPDEVKGVDVKGFTVKSQAVQTGERYSYQQYMDLKAQKSAGLIVQRPVNEGLGSVWRG